MKKAFKTVTNISWEQTFNKVLQYAYFPIY